MFVDLRFGYSLRIGLTLAALLLIGSCATSQSDRPASGSDLSSQKYDSPTPRVDHSKPDDRNPSSATSSFRTASELHGIRFVVESPNTLAGNTVTVVPSGLEISNDPFTSPINGVVVDAQVGDLNVDQSPEVYVFVREHGGLERFSVVAYATNSRKSMSEFTLPEPDLAAKEYSGYNGWDEFEVIENVLSRKFPVFERVGGQMRKTRRTRIVQYKIKQGEATWQFFVKRFDEF